MSSPQEIQKQIEYYLSDKNLERDEYFHKEISASEDGFIKIDIFLNCNKIKKMGIKKQNIVEALQESKEVELNEGKDKVRRTNNKELPPLIQKKQKTDDKNGKEESKQDKTEKKVENLFENYEPIYFQLSTEKETKIKFVSVQQEMEKQFQIKPVYVRFAKMEGNFVLNKNAHTQELFDKIIAVGLRVDETQIKVTLCEGEEFQNFIAKHGTHYETCIQQKKLGITQEPSKSNGNKKKQDKNNRKNRIKKFTFNNEKFGSIENLKGSFKGVLSKSVNGQKIEEPFHGMLKEILKYHEKSTEKLENLDHFTVDVNPEFKQTRCFYVVTNDGKRKDFSIVKCLKNFEDQL